ncbi:MAG: hypothetical protein ACRD96_11410 [Bryobacteraceae bacterium]
MLLVVGGHTRNIGKTSVVAALIAAVPEAGWTAIKITQHGHGICSAAGEPCDCAVEYDHPYAISEERGAALGSDSARFLTAGARRAFWLRTAVGQLGHALPALRELIAPDARVIVESNSLLQFYRPDLYLFVADGAVADFKESALRYLDRADALVAVSDGAPVWTGVSRRLWDSKPRFRVGPPEWTTPDLVELVRARLV